MQAVGASFQILTAAMSRDDHIDPRAAGIDVEVPSALLDPGNGLVLSELPSSLVRIDATDMRNPEMRILSWCFVHALDLNVLSHSTHLLARISCSRALGR